MTLTDKDAKNARPREKTYRLWDGEGLYLEVTPAARKHWRIKYRFGGKERTLTVGDYPNVSLREARDRRYSAKKALADGVDPRLGGKGGAGNSFKGVAQEWIKKQSAVWAPDYVKNIVGRLDLHVFEKIGPRPVEALTPTEILSVLTSIEAQGIAETAHRVKAIISQILRYAVATGRITSDPSRDLRGALAPVKKGHFPAITEPKKVGALLKMIDSYDGSVVVRHALRLAPLVFVRPGELRKAEWGDIDLKAAEWCYVVPKTGQQHIVPLSRQAIEILISIQRVSGRGRYVFPSLRGYGVPMCNAAILAALRSMEIPKEQMCGHGFRAMARTLLDEALGFPPHLIEHQLAHTVKDALGRAYNRTKHLPERREMMQRWADYLDELRTKKDESAES